MSKSLPASNGEGYPAAMASAFDMLPCTWSEGPSANQTDVNPERSARKEERVGTPPEMLLREADILLSELGIIYVLRASSLRRAYQQAKAKGDISTPGALELLAILPFGRDRRVFVRQARTALQGKAIDVRLVADPRAMSGLSRAELTHRGDAHVLLTIDLVEVHRKGLGFRV
jgi:hypothetical protein